MATAINKCGVILTLLSYTYRIVYSRSRMYAQNSNQAGETPQPAPLNSAARV